MRTYTLLLALLLSSLCAGCVGEKSSDGTPDLVQDTAPNDMQMTVDMGRDEGPEDTGMDSGEDTSDVADLSDADDAVEVVEDVMDEDMGPVCAISFSDAFDREPAAPPNTLGMDWRVVPGFEAPILMDGQVCGDTQSVAVVDRPCYRYETQLELSLDFVASDADGFEVYFILSDSLEVLEGQSYAIGCDGGSLSACTLGVFDPTNMVEIGDRIEVPLTVGEVYSLDMRLNDGVLELTLSDASGGIETLIVDFPTGEFVPQMIAVLVGRDVNGMLTCFDNFGLLAI